MTWLLTSEGLRLAAILPTWSENSTGMIQFIVWTALAAEGMGASLQHVAAFSEEITPNISKEWNLPSTWKVCVFFATTQYLMSDHLLLRGLQCTAMMPFGVATREPGQGGPKTFTPILERVLLVE
jgi:uncharacterized protein